jgi:hypothetical protein
VLDQDVHIDAKEVGMGRSGAGKTAAIHGHLTIGVDSILNFSQSGGILGGMFGAVPHSGELLNKSGSKQSPQGWCQCMLEDF